MLVTIQIGDGTEFLEACKAEAIPVFENGYPKIVSGRPAVVTFKESGRSAEEWAGDVLANDLAMRLMRSRCAAENAKVKAALAQARSDNLDHAEIKVAVDAARAAANVANAQHRMDVLAIDNTIRVEA